MTRRDVLILLRELIQVSGKSIYHEDDPSGAFTEYVVDQERLLEEIDKQVNEEDKE